MDEVPLPSKESVGIFRKINLNFKRQLSISLNRFFSAAFVCTLMSLLHFQPQKAAPS